MLKVKPKIIRKMKEALRRDHRNIERL
jgi:hypothetical protein